VLSLNLTRESMRFLATLDAKPFRQVVSKVFALLTDPSPQDAVQLKDYPYRRVDSGEYRIIYAVESSLPLVYLIGKRNDDDIYKRLGRRS
jgi:mRNA interferase RelE/StbE